jgi:hypothetical protein
MFESAARDHLRLADSPFVDGQTLIELKTVLQTALRADVLQAQHHSLTAGGADATVPHAASAIRARGDSPADLREI